MAHLATNADLIIHEATNAAIEDDEDEDTVIRSAVSHGHSTPGMAGTFARICGARILILTHFSSRYKGDESVESLNVMNRIATEAKEYFGRDDVVTARDFMTIQIPIHRPKNTVFVAPKMAAKDAAKLADLFLQRAGVLS